MALKLTAILLLVLFVTLKFGGRTTENGPFVEMPNATPDTVIAQVAPLEEALEPPQEPAEPAAPALAAAATPAPDATRTAPTATDLPQDTTEALRNQLGESVEGTSGSAALNALNTAGSAASGLAGLAPSATAPTAETPPAAPLVMAEVTGTVVNLRAGPSTGNAVVGQARAGERVEWVSSPAPGWALIRHPAIDGDAYMSANYLRRLAN